MWDRGNQSLVCLWRAGKAAQHPPSLQLPPSGAEPCYTWGTIPQQPRALQHDPTLKCPYTPPPPINPGCKPPGQSGEACPASTLSQKHP